MFVVHYIHICMNDDLLCFYWPKQYQSEQHAPLITIADNKKKNNKYLFLLLTVICLKVNGKKGKNQFY